jgi:hypothetical protein
MKIAMRGIAIGSTMLLTTTLINLGKLSIALKGFWRKLLASVIADSSGAAAGLLVAGFVVAPLKLLAPEVGAPVVQF